LRLITPRRGRPTVAVDAFICLHDTVVEDRKLAKPNSILAKLLSWLEANTIRHADLVFIDTELQKNQLIARYRCANEKLVVTPVGIDESIWAPLPALPLGERFQVLFWGTFIPLHGIGTIISAARILSLTHPQIDFQIVGDGQTAEEIAEQLEKAPLANLQWRRELVSAKQLRSYVEQAHCILGVFGSSLKAGSVIPYKAYQAMASNKILITRSSPAFSVFDTPGNHVRGLVLVPPGSAEALAAAILDTYRQYAEISAGLATRSAYDSHLNNRLLQECVQEGVNKVC
jgi:glycosyltransferase involved in cell wall biosynthesis